jgi:hypothetical protein
METTFQTTQAQIVQPIFRKIYEIREQKVMFDFDLAELYGVETKVLNQAVKRNLKRFPLDFMFQLNKDEFVAQFDTQSNNQSSQIVFFNSQSSKNLRDTNLRSQIVTSSLHGGSRYMPYAFTEQGIAMLSSVLRSERAIEVNIAIMRVFVEMRKLFLNHQELLSKVAELAHKVGEHDQYIKTLYDYLKSFDEEQKRREEWENRKPIGFIV